MNIPVRKFIINSYLRIRSPKIISIMKKDDQQFLTLFHLSQLSGFILPSIGSFLVPLVIWILRKDQINNLDYHARAVLNFQIVLFCTNVTAILTFITYVTNFEVRFSNKNNYILMTFFANTIWKVTVIHFYGATKMRFVSSSRNELYSSKRMD